LFAENVLPRTSPIPVPDTGKWVEFAALMMETKAVDHATLGKLFGSPKMRDPLLKHEKAKMEAVLGEKWWQPSRWHQHAQ
jgi:hypothetical protein